jgi:hypothetical protein
MDLPGIGRREFLAKATRTFTATLVAGSLAACGSGGRRRNARSRSVVSGGAGDNDAVSCFLPGTRIATAKGTIAVETLRIGDLVQTASGPQPVKWIGRSLRHRPAAGWSLAMRPVRIRRSAMAHNVPSRDLLVSREHSLFLDGVLIPAYQLINGTTITEEPWDHSPTLELFNIELAEHQVIFANGVAVETLLANKGRDQFDNAAEYALLYGPDTAITAKYAPVIRYGRRRDRALAAVRRWLTAWGLDLRDASMRAHDRFAARAQMAG